MNILNSPKSPCLSCDEKGDRTVCSEDCEVLAEYRKVLPAKRTARSKRSYTGEGSRRVGGRFVASEENPF